MVGPPSRSDLVRKHLSRAGYWQGPPGYWPTRILELHRDRLLWRVPAETRPSFHSFFSSCSSSTSTSTTDPSAEGEVDGIANAFYLRSAILHVHPTSGKKLTLRSPSGDVLRIEFADNAHRDEWATAMSVAIGQLEGDGLESPRLATTTSPITPISAEAVQRDGDAGNLTSLGELKAMFPDVEESLVLQVMHTCHGDASAAANELIQMMRERELGPLKECTVSAKS